MLTASLLIISAVDFGVHGRAIGLAIVDCSTFYSTVYSGTGPTIVDYIAVAVVVFVVTVIPIINRILCNLTKAPEQLRHSIFKHLSEDGRRYDFVSHYCDF